MQNVKLKVNHLRITYLLICNIKLAICKVKYTDVEYGH